MLPQFEKELKELENTMILAEKFAEKVPTFSKEILDRKFTGNEEIQVYSNRYNDMYVNRIKRAIYTHVLNKTGIESTHLFCIEIDLDEMFDESSKIDIKSLIENPNVLCHEYYVSTQHGNQVFYIKDENVSQFMEQLYEWYDSTNKKLTLEKLKDDLERAKKNISALVENVHK